MTLTQLIIPILMAANTQMVVTPVTASPSAISPAVAAPVADTSPPTKLEFPLAGFRINSLVSSAMKEGGFGMSLPVSGDTNLFPSVGVHWQPTMKERPSLQNMKDAKTLRAHNDDTILMERTASPAEWLMEYTSDKTVMGTKAGPKQHIYRRMVSANGLTYDISATTLDTQWPEFGPKLKACVDSFELSAVPAPGKVALPYQGYRISKLDVAAPADAQQEPLSMMSLLNGVNVKIEPYTKTLKDYQAEHLSRVTIPNGKIKILAENSPAEDTLVTEYVEEIPVDKSHTRGNQFNPLGNLLVYEKAVLAHGQLYRATGLHWDWDKTVSYAQIKACVDSLEAIPTPAPAK